MKVLAIVQARTNSSRLPCKILKKINNMCIIEILLKRLNKSKILDKIVVSTTTSNFDDDLVDIVKKNNFDVFRGNEKNVLDRFYKTALKYKAKNIVRITGDCPLIDAQIVDKVIKFHFKKNNEITSNSHEPTFPDGMDVEIFSFNSLKNAWKKAKSNDDKEHVTPFIKRNYLVSLFKNEIDYSNIRITLDEAEDFKPHKMYDPETGKAYDVKTMDDHLKYKKMGYSHEKPNVEESAASDARRAIALDPSTKQKFSKNVSATDDDIKSADKNIMMQMRKAVSLRGNKVEFMDKKKVEIPQKIAQAVLDKYNSQKRPADKEKFQTKVSKSYKDMLQALKETNEKMDTFHEVKSLMRKFRENDNG